MAPLEDKFDVSTQEQLDAEQLINGPLTTQTTLTTASWQNPNVEDNYKVMIQQQEVQQAQQQQQHSINQVVGPRDLNESLLQSNERGGQLKSKNYGACEQIDLDKKSINSQEGRDQLVDSFSKSFKLDDQLDRKIGDFNRNKQQRSINQNNVELENKRKNEKSLLNNGGKEGRGSGNGGVGGDRASMSTTTTTSTNTLANKRTVLERAARVIPGLGIILALCASLSLGTAGMLVKMTRSVNGIQVAVLRSLIQLIIYSVIISIRRLRIFPEQGEWIPVFGRALLGATSMCFTYYALNLIPLGDATAIRFSLPIWTLIVSYFFLSESCHFTKVLAIVVAVIGVVLIAKPDDCIYLVHLILKSFGYESAKEFKIHAKEHEEAREHELELLMDQEQQLVSRGAINNVTTLSDGLLVKSNVFDSDEMAARHLEGCLLALASSILLALSLIALRMAKKTPAEITIFWLSLLSIFIGNCLLFALNEWSLPNNLTDISYILLNGLCGSAGQWFITSALKIEQSSIIALARTFDIEVAFLYSAFLLHENIRTTSIVGAVLVSLGVIIVVVPKWLNCGGENQQENDDEVEQQGPNNAMQQELRNCTVESPTQSPLPPPQTKSMNYNTLVINDSTEIKDDNGSSEGKSVNKPSNIIDISHRNRHARNYSSLR